MLPKNVIEMHADVEYNINQDGPSDVYISVSNETIRVAVRQNFPDRLAARPRRETQSLAPRVKFRVISSEIGKMIYS